jgi:hypothetical protein
MRSAKLLFAVRFGGRRCCYFPPSCLLAWSPSRQAARRITARSIKLGHEVRLMSMHRTRDLLVKQRTQLIKT